MMCLIRSQNENYFINEQINRYIGKTYMRITIFDKNKN